MIRPLMGAPVAMIQTKLRRFFVPASSTANRFPLTVSRDAVLAMHKPPLTSNVCGTSVTH